MERKGQQQGPMETKAAVRLVWPYFLSDDTLKAVGLFYLVSMPGEVKYPTQGGKRVT